MLELDNAIVQYKKDENSNLPDEEVGINVAVQNVNFKKAGLYSTEVIVEVDCYL